MSLHATDQELTVAELAKKTYLRYDQRRELELSTSQVRQLLDHPELQGEAEPEVLEKQYEREMAMLQSGTPPQYDSVGMNKVARMERHLREKMTHTMPTRTQMERGNDPNNVDFHTAWERVHQPDALAWKTCLLILDSDNQDPNFLSIARLRSDTVKGDPRKYANGYDYITWQENIEEDLIRDMDDAVYMRFLEYKLLEWSKPLICKELEWSSALYEAAMARLRTSRNPKAPASLDLDAQPNFPSEGDGTETPRGWPKNEIAALGISNRAFCEVGNINTSEFYKFSKDGEWRESTRQKVINTLRRLKEEQSREPAPESGEPVDVENAEPVYTLQD